MKKSTLLLLALAVIGGALVYYLEIKPGKPRDEEADTSREAFKLTREEIQQITLTRGGQTFAFENKDNKWLMTQPVSGTADETALNSLIGDLVSVKITRDLKASAEEVKSYGLAEPKVKIDLKLKDGKSHSIQLGGKDFSESNVYAKVDGSNDVSLIAASLLTNADKGLNDWRDRSVFGGLTDLDIKALKLNTESGPIALSKAENGWNITAPLNSAAEESETSSLISEITAAKASEIVADAADDLGKYGLTKAKLGATATLTAGNERSLLIGAKVDEMYYAKLSDRPAILKIEKALYDKLNVKLSALRSKTIIKVIQDDATRVELKNPNIPQLIVEPDKEHTKWLVKAPADKKDKEASAFKLFTPLQSKAEEILDKVPPAVAAKLAKPVVVMSITTKDGKTHTVRISDADGDKVYVRVDGNPAVYKVAKVWLDSLSFKLDEVVTGT
ncbi:MAG: DUF4340 domain-containing protein [Acidobacteria bacterium]|nr:DUF4340 domain-containing protein [Acidobacteriota bacterium]